MSEVPTSGRYKRIAWDLFPRCSCRCRCRTNHPWQLDVCISVTRDPRQDLPGADPCPGCATAIACAPVARQVY